MRLCTVSRFPPICTTKRDHTTQHCALLCPTSDTHTQHSYTYHLNHMIQQHNKQYISTLLWHPHTTILTRWHTYMYIVQPHNQKRPYHTVYLTLYTPPLVSGVAVKEQETHISSAKSQHLYLF